jgi:hopanoid-associated phosphorylase
MLPTTQLPVIAVTGLAFEARIAAGPGVITISGPRSETLAAAISAAVARGCLGIISFGIAGGLASHVKPGTCVVARSVVTADRRFESHSAWSNRLLEAIPGAIHADIAGAHLAVSNPAEKQELARSTGAVAVDMESVLSVTAATMHNLPFAAVRVVADPSHRGLPPAALGTILPDGTTDLSAVLRSIVTRPGQLSALIRLALDTRTARTALVRSRRLLGPGLGFIDPLADAAAVPAE